MLLGQAARLLDGLGALAGTGAQLLGFVLDLFVETLEGGEHAVLNILFAVQVHGNHALGVIAEVLKHTSHAAGAGTEVVALLEGFVHGLFQLFVSPGLSDP